jgi:hypothetical protein
MNSIGNPSAFPVLEMRRNCALVRYEVFTAVTMKNGVFWDVMPCGSCKNRRFGELGTTLAATSNRRIGISSQHASVASCN